MVGVFFLRRQETAVFDALAPYLFTNFYIIFSSPEPLNCSRGSTAATDEVLKLGLSDALEAAMECDEKLATDFIAFVEMLLVLIFEGRKALAKVSRSCRGLASKSRSLHGYCFSKSWIPLSLHFDVQMRPKRVVALTSGRDRSHRAIIEAIKNKVP